MSCAPRFGSEVRCEAKYVWPAIPEWSTTVGSETTRYGPGSGEGFGMTMTIGERWTLIEMDIEGQVLRAYARRMNGKTFFKRSEPAEEIAAKPP